MDAESSTAISEKAPLFDEPVGEPHAQQGSRTHKSGRVAPEGTTSIRRRCANSFHEREHTINRRRTFMLGTVRVALRDPLVKLFENDKVICQVQGDPEKLFASYLKGACWSLVLQPYYIPCWALFCCFCPSRIPEMKETLQHSASAGNLILRERTLVYRLDQCSMLPTHPGYFSTDCVDAKLCQGMELVIPLDDEFDLEVIPPYREPRFDEDNNPYYPVETLVLKVGGTVIASIDAPTETTAFVAAVERQKVQIALTEEVSAQISPEILEMHQGLIKFFTEIVGPKSVAWHQNEVRGWRNAERNKRTNDLVSEHLPHLSAAQNASQPISWPLDWVTERKITSAMKRAQAPWDRNDPLMNPLFQMTSEDVSAMLIELDLQGHCSSFAKARVDGAMLNVMDDDTLKELGVTSALDRKQVLAWITRKRYGERVFPVSYPTAPPSTPPLPESSVEEHEISLGDSILQAHMRRACIPMRHACAATEFC